MYVQFEKELMNSSAKCGIMSYSFSAGLGLHTFAIDYNGVDIYSYNRYTGKQILKVRLP